MSFRSTFSGYPKILNVWSIYSQYHNRQANKTKNFWDLHMDIYHTFLQNNKMNIQDIFPFLAIS